VSNLKGNNAKSMLEEFITFLYINTWD